MIFVTIGSMLPFNRLIETMDDWARRHPDKEIVAQIGEGTYEPTKMKWVRMVTNSEFIDYIAKAELIVAHAGTGSVFSAMEFGKPIVLVPRYAAAREHTTDHQVHTANWLRDRPGVVVCEKDDNLDDKIDEAMAKSIEVGAFSKSAPAPFLAKIRDAVAK